MSPTEQIAAYAAKISFDELPASVIDKAKLLIADNIGCAIRGPSNLLGKSAVELARELGGTPEATILGTNIETNCLQAAFVNSVLANSMDFDDIGPLGHPGSTIVPAALAAAERERATGKDLITAVIAGYEVCERVGYACNASPERLRQVSGLGTHQVFGSAAASGKIFGLSHEEMLNAFGIAGPWAAIPHSGKFANPLERGRQVSFIKDNVSKPAQSGLLAALLAKKGWIGNRSIFDGAKGFWIMMSSDRFRPEYLCSFDGFRILDVSHKPYPACRWSHTSLDAMVGLISEHGLHPELVESVVAHTIRPVAEGFGNQNPANIVDAVFSMAYPLAMILFGVPKSQWYVEDNLRSPAYLEMASRIDVELDTEAQQEYESQETVADFVPTTVVATTKEGQTFSKYAELPKGTPANPLTVGEIKEKFISLTSEVLGLKRCSALWDNLQSLEEIGDVSELAATMRPAA